MMNKRLLIAKFNAFGIHFSLNLIIFFIVLYFVFQWYPMPFFNTDGGWQGIRIIAGVDLVLGPTLTFIVFNPQKKPFSLRVDLSLIALAQISALAWGIWAVHNERPYLAVFADGIFYPMAYYQIPETGLDKKAIDELDPSNMPKKIYVDTPSNEQEYMALLMKAVASQPIHFMGERYRKFDYKQLNNIMRFNIDMDAYLEGEKDAWHREYQHFVKNHIIELESIAYFPLHARYGKFIIALNKNTLEFIDVLDIPPPDIDEIIWGKEEAKRRRQRDEILQEKAEEKK